jgi:hypothetical protein
VEWAVPMAAEHPPQEDEVIVIDQVRFGGFIF